MDVKHICETWIKIQSELPLIGAWDDGIDKFKVLGLLFNFKHLTFRCKTCHDRFAHFSKCVDLLIELGSESNPIVI